LEFVLKPAAVKRKQTKGMEFDTLKENEGVGLFRHKKKGERK